MKRWNPVDSETLAKQGLSSTSILEKYKRDVDEASIHNHNKEDMHR